jgi:hypothetical protein
LYADRFKHQTIILAMMRKQKLFVIRSICRVVVLSCLSNSLFAQAETQFRDLFTQYSAQGVQEEIFVHSDKDVYLAGEICWFKVYCMDAFLHRPLSISKLAYWELLDRHNAPVARLKIALADGFGSGSYQLPQNISSGTYKIRCYTHWMKNFDAGFFFEKEITVIYPHQFHDKDTVKTLPSGAIRLYPEGGNLVNQIPSTVAFKILGPGNKAEDGNGYLIDDLNDTLQAIRTEKMGIGKFVFTPQSNRSYKAIILMPHSEPLVAELPKAYDEGYVMHLSDTDAGHLNITVQTRGNRASSGMVYLFVHTRGSIKEVRGGLVRNNQVLFVMDKDRLGDGISHFTIFDAEKNPVCERLFFHYPRQRLGVQVSLNKDIYGTREGVHADVRTREDTFARPANLSMAVYRIDSLQAMDRMNIENYIWLRADLTGDVDSPEYYFDSANRERETAVDDLMLTQGWRRFRWENVLQQKKPVFQFLPEYTGHIITAEIFDSTTKISAPGRGAFVSSPGIHPIFNAAVSDSNGMLRFDMKDFYTNGELIIRPAKSADSMLTVEVQSPFSNVPSGKPLSTFSFGHIDSANLAEYYKDILVQDEFLGAQLGKFDLPAVDTLAFFGKPDFTYFLDDYVRFTTMEEVLREYVAQTSVRNRAGELEVSILDRRREHTLLEPAPLVLLDGVPTDINKVMSYDPLKVRRLDIVTEAYYYRNMAFGGILSFVTYGGDLPGFDLDPHSVVLDYPGLEAQREFYGPRYDTKEELESRLPDFRRLLYWQPTIVTNREGHSSQSFFTSDSPGKYVMVVQGVSPNGRLGYAVKEFTVR